MAELIAVGVERWPVAGSFVISRGAKTHVDVVTCIVGDGLHRGRGEGTPIYYKGEDAEGCAEAIRAFAARGPFDRASVNAGMTAGAARNALDCALWELEAQAGGQPVWALAGLAEPVAMATAFTISLGEPDVMEAAALRAAAAGYGLLKCKLTGEGDLARVGAVRRGAPDVRLIVDANESWGDLDIAAEAAALAALGVELVEQPVPRGQDERLYDVVSPIPFCADESCQTAADLDRLGMYQAINIKLDKAGGLTEALRLAEGARVRGQVIMVGCMLGTSLGIAPAFLAAQDVRWVDLDGALLLAEDREGALVAEQGLLRPGSLWG
ncbi:dipeptide epimerase [Sphingobium sufflavum]|uniref:dipeptide epimerase n=1 Tax=Sphingobium sufflavum TaxID=1129547 RepID=UPI001F47ABF9|nr:dipeptide epimerase [Sphingobium sufflavum]MCE7798756.1 dipeptide epimerase [Sphingobium sufflavum]